MDWFIAGLLPRGLTPAPQMATGVYLARNFLSSLTNTLADPDREKHEQARLQAKAHLERLRKGKNGKSGEDPSDDSTVSRRGPKPEELVLNEYENLIALEMIAPEDIPVGFSGTHALRQDMFAWPAGFANKALQILVAWRTSSMSSRSLSFTHSQCHTCILMRRHSFLRRLVCCYTALLDAERPC